MVRIISIAIITVALTLLSACTFTVQTRFAVSPDVLEPSPMEVYP
jgi:outer membrane lipopolysaccharide assembly protein LptE/RlpB